MGLSGEGCSFDSEWVLFLLSAHPASAAIAGREVAGEISRGIGLLRVNAEGDTPSALVHALFEAASRKEVARAERLLHRAFSVISISLITQ